MLPFVLFVATQSAGAVRQSSAIHPVLGWLTALLLIALYGSCLAMPILLVLRLRAPLATPDSAPGTPVHTAWQNAQLKRYRANPQLVQHCFDTDAPLEQQLAEARRILDRKADDLIHETAGIVFMSTAVSQSGRLDGLMVLGTHLRMIWRIAHLYNQRPSVRELLCLYRDTALCAVLAYSFDELLDSMQERIAELVAEITLPSAVAVVPGISLLSSILATSLAEGSANAFLTLRAGIIARRYCGSPPRTPRAELRSGVSVEALGLLRAITLRNGQLLVNRCTQAAAQAVKSGISHTVSKVGALFTGKAAAANTDAPTTSP